MSYLQFPNALLERPEEWSGARALIQGIIGPGAPSQEDPMSNFAKDGSPRAMFFESFGPNVTKLLTQPLNAWEAAGNGNGILAWSRDVMGFDADDVFLWGGAERSTLSVSQLDTIAQSQEKNQVHILVKSFGARLSGAEVMSVCLCFACTTI
jgi:hypothetical protein